MISRFPRRSSIRLKDYDYAKPGAYFVTICVRKQECLLGSVINGEMKLNFYGNIVSKVWQCLFREYPYVHLDEWQIMPNHLHGIFVLRDYKKESQSDSIDGIKVKPVGRLLGAFKTVSTKKINAIRLMTGGPFWQRNFYEHVIRNEESLNRIRDYIMTNPQRWELDKENPMAVGKDDFDLWLSTFNSKAEIN